MHFVLKPAENYNSGFATIKPHAWQERELSLEEEESWKGHSKQESMVFHKGVLARKEESFFFLLGSALVEFCSQDVRAPTLGHPTSFK